VFNITTGLTIWCSEAVTLAAVLFLAWHHDRKALAYLMWSLGFVVSAIGFALAAAHGFIPTIFSIEISNALALSGESAWIAGFYLLDKRKPEWSALLPPAIWLAGVFLPWVNESFANRVVLYNLAGAAGATLLASAVRPSRYRREAVRAPLAFVFMAFACVCFFVALAMVVMRPSETAALNYRAVSALGSALLITMSIALTGRLLMERSERRLRSLTITDSLTSVLNRRGLQECFGQMINKSGDPSLMVAALLFDLDHFKRINDTHGHQAGDKVLCEFSRVAQNSIPRGGVFGRMGGEEFIAFMLISDPEEAETIAELIRSEFCRAPVLASSTRVTATVSVGVAVRLLADAEWDGVISEADRALYSAKGAGRNCTVIFGQEEPTGSTNRQPDPHAGELVPNLDDQINTLRRLGTLSRM
jgi:diguanylate cyclase (GGDEF)-like protein